MTDDTAPTPQPSEIGNAESINLSELRERTAHQAALAAFPSGSLRDRYWTNQLDGLPFIVTSEPVYRVEDGKFGPQEQADVIIRLVNLTDEKLSEAKNATLTGRFLLNQLKSMTRHELVGSVIWTVGRNPGMPEYTNGHPYMLRVFDVSQVTDGDSPFGEPDMTARAAGLARFREQLRQQTSGE